MMIELNYMNIIDLNNKKRKTIIKFMQKNKTMKWKENNE